MTLKFLDEIALEVGYMAIYLAILGLMIYLCTKFDAIRRVFAILTLAT